MRLISEKVRVARKSYDCEACEWVNESGLINEGLFSVGEYKSYIKAKRNEFKIEVGQEYLIQVFEDGGRLHDYKALPEVHQICINHDLYEPF